MAKEINNDAIRQEKVEASVSKTEKIYQENKKTIWGIVIGALVVGLLILGYQKLVREPKMAEAMEQTYPAEFNFQAGNFELALNGDDNVLGFAQIIDEYGSFSGKAVYLYAGVCCMQLGKNEEALEYLKKYSGKDKIMKARAYALQGDACVNLEKYDEAVNFYDKAVSVSDNMYAAAYLFKKGQVCEALGNKAEALKCYETIKEQYPQTYEGMDINSYIENVKVAE